MATKKKPHPTARDWDKIDALYLRGESLDYIVKAFPHLEFSKKTIMNRASKLKLVDKKKNIDDSVKDHLMKVIERDKLEANEKTLSLFRDGERVIELLLKQYLEEAIDGDNVRKLKAKATAYNVDLIMNALTKSQNGIRKCLGMDKDGNPYEKEPDVLVIKGIDMDKV